MVLLFNHVSMDRVNRWYQWWRMNFWIRVRNRSGIILPEPILANNVSHLIRGGYFPLPLQRPGSFVCLVIEQTSSVVLPSIRFEFLSQLYWSPHSISWSGCVNGACLEAGNVFIQGYQVIAGSTSASNSHPSIHYGHLNLHYLPLPCKGLEDITLTYLHKWLHLHTES